LSHGREHVFLLLNLVELRCRRGAICVDNPVGWGGTAMDLFTTLLVKVISGILYVAYWLMLVTLWVVWWLTLYLLLSLGAGVAWLARGRQGREKDTGRFGRYLEDGAGWLDAASGVVYPLGQDHEFCRVEAEETGIDWRHTARSRLLRRGTIIRYRFAAVTDPGSTGRPGIAAWREFPHEARKNMRLDELDPAGPGAAGRTPDVMAAVDANRDAVLDALDDLGRLLSQRGWTLVQPPSGEQPHPWYANRYSRRAILFDTVIPATVAAEPADGQP
jgi:hypothetical protein